MLAHTLSLLYPYAYRRAAIAMSSSVILVAVAVVHVPMIFYSILCPSWALANQSRHAIVSVWPQNLQCVRHGLFPVPANQLNGNRVQHLGIQAPPASVFVINVEHAAV